jgi:hypothetical protein
MRKQQEPYLEESQQAIGDDWCTHHRMGDSCTYKYSDMEGDQCNSVSTWEKIRQSNTFDQCWTSSILSIEAVPIQNKNELSRCWNLYRAVSRRRFTELHPVRLSANAIFGQSRQLRHDECGHGWNVGGRNFELVGALPAEGTNGDVNHMAWQKELQPNILLDTKAARVRLKQYKTPHWRALCESHLLQDMTSDSQAWQLCYTWGSGEHERWESLNALNNLYSMNDNLLRY